MQHSIFPMLFTLCDVILFSTSSLLLASLLDGFNLCFLTGALAWFFKITKVAPFEFFEMPWKNPFLPLIYSLLSSTVSLRLHHLLLALLISLMTWPSNPLPSMFFPLQRPTQKTVRLNCLSEHWHLLLNLRKCEVCLFLVDSHPAHLQLHLSLFNYFLCFNPPPTFLGSHLAARYSFLNMYLC